jgi:hypothetical protein
MPNTYRVILTKVTGPGAPRPPWAGRPGPPPSPAEHAAYQQQVEEIKKQQRLWIPEAYTKPDTTPLHVSVPLKEKLNIELSSASAAGASGQSGT